MTSFRSHLRRLSAGALLAALAFSGSAGIASAQYWNGPPPPPPQREHYVFRKGYVWQGGHWRRVAGRWVWAPGRPVAVIPGRHWVNGYWRMTPRGRIWVDGHWS